jgi:hypothetical protein
MYMELYFSDYFEVEPSTLEEYGAFNISVVTDLPLFIDPFLLFNSEKPEYQALHEEIINYLIFLRDEAKPGLDLGLIKAWYTFKEVRQNWLGYTQFGNGGSGLGKEFAIALHGSLGTILSNFGEEDVTQGSHLEKLTLIKSGVGKDNISDFTTNLIKDYLLTYTEKFARAHIDAKYCKNFSVIRARFNYTTKTWETRTYYLPKVENNYVVLTPSDILTRDDTWINHADMVRSFDHLPEAIDDDQLRAQVQEYFKSRLSKKPTSKERSAAAQATIEKFRELIDLYIRLKEDSGDQAQAISLEKMEDTRRALVAQVRVVIPDLEQKTKFYEQPWTSYEESREKAILFKQYVENQDGYRVINRGNGEPFSRESEVQLFFGLLWMSTDFDVNREPNNGRGPVDFKVSFGAKDKSLIEFKLASSSSLKRNLEKQVAIYEKANQTHTLIALVEIPQVCSLKFLTCEQWSV